MQAQLCLFSSLSASLLQGYLFPQRGLSFITMYLV